MTDAESAAVEFFDRPATLGDVLGWILVFQLATLTFIASRIPSAIEKFKPMFDSLRGELPSVTKWVLGTPGFIWLLVPLALTATAMWLLVKSRNGTVKVVFPACAYFVALAMIGLVILGIFYPILQLQSAVRGS